LRVIAGLAKGRHLLSVPGEGTRPITDRVKGSLFSILGSDIEGCAFLDLFAGTGSVGIEALSRGAERVVMIERARKAIAVIKKNLEITKLQGAEVIQTDAFRYLAHADQDVPFDYIYVAPPQYEELWAKALLALNDQSLLAPDGRIIVQIHPKEYHPLNIPNLTLVRERSYGSTVLHFYARRDDVGDLAAPIRDAEDADDMEDGE